MLRLWGGQRVPLLQGPRARPERGRACNSQLPLCHHRDSAKVTMRVSSPCASQRDVCTQYRHQGESNSLYRQRHSETGVGRNGENWGGRMILRDKRGWGGDKQGERKVYTEI